MEKKGQLYEIIIKLTYALISFIAAIFVIKNMLSMAPLFKSFSYQEFELVGLIHKTPFKSILKDIGTIDSVNVEILIKGFFSFLSSLEWISIVFLILFVCLLILYFTFIKWSLVKDYLFLSALEILFFLLKYILFGLSFAIFYKGGGESMALSFIIGTILFYVFSLAQLFILSLWIIKFIFNIGSDLKYYYSH